MKARPSPEAGRLPSTGRELGLDHRSVGLLQGDGSCRESADFLTRGQIWGAALLGHEDGHRQRPAEGRGRARRAVFLDTQVSILRVSHVSQNRIVI